MILYLQALGIRTETAEGTHGAHVHLIQTARLQTTSYRYADMTSRFENVDFKIMEIIKQDDRRKE